MRHSLLAISGALFVVVAISTLAFAGADFFTVPVFPVGTGPASIALGDFNNDGITDVATSGVNSVSVLLGNKNGTFQAPVDYSVIGIATEVGVGDFNGDGRQDIAVLFSTGAIGMNLLLGNGDGTFQPAHSLYFPGGLRTAMVFGDFNGDGHLDVAVANNHARSVSVLLGKGNGSFQLEVNYSTGLHDDPVALAVGDINGDGKLDLIAGSTVAKIFIGNGDGTFQNEVDGPNVGTVVFLADLNNDGKLDLLGNAGPTLNVAVGNGDGTFQTLAAYANPGYTSVQSIAVLDLNGDGKPDVVVDDANSQAISALLGNGDGTLQAPALYLVGTDGVAIASGTFGNGHKPGVAVTDGLPGVALAIPNPDGTLQAPRVTPVPDAIVAAVGDLNSDGKMDVVTGAGGRVDVSYGNGDSSFQPPIETIINIFMEWIAVGDLNGDGKPDVVAAGNSPAVAGVLLNNGDGTLGTPVNYNLGTDVIEVALGDFNGDHKLDIAAVSFRDSTISVLINNGDGTFKPAIVTPAASGSQGLTLADFNGDGKLDAAVQGSTQVSVLFGKGDGTFSSSTNYTDQGTKLRAADFNGDGKPDLAVGNPGHQVQILLNNGDGTFGTPSLIPITASASALAVADFNGDGKQDIVAGSYGFSTLNGNGNGTFRRLDIVNTCFTPVLLVGDFNSDGRPDLLTACESQVEVLPNAAGPH